MAITATISSKWVETKLLHVFGTFTIGAGNYATGGIRCNMQELLASQRILTTKDALWVRADGIAGYKYEYVAATTKLMIRTAPAVTPAGTISAPVFTGSALAAHAHDLLVKGGQAASTTNNIANYATAILGKEEATDATFLGSAAGTKGGVITVTAGTPAGTNSVPVFSGTAVAAAALAELAVAALPAGVTGDTVTFYAVFPKA